MTQGNQEDILFPEEIIPWDEVVRLVINLLIPFRHRAKGIECITGGLSSYKSVPDGYIQWLPFAVKDKEWEFIKEHLQDLPSLEFPVPLGIANEFIEKFIMLKDSPSIVPSILTHESLIYDQQKRDYLFVPEKEELNRLVSEHDVFLVDTSRKKCIGLAHGVYFTKREAIHYLEKKGLLDRAYAMGCSWRDQIREPEIGGLPPSIEVRYYGFPQELITMGIQEYRRTLTLRRSEVIASQLAHLYPKFETEQVIEEDSGEIISSVPVSELDSIPVENGSNLAVDVAPLIQVSLPTTVGSNNVKSRSFKDPVVSEGDEVKSMKENPATDSEITLVGESDPAATRLIGMKEVMDRLGVSRQTVYNYMDPELPSYNPNFPQPRLLNGENKWIESEFDAFVKSLPQHKKKKRNETESVSEIFVTLQPCALAHDLSFNNVRAETLNTAKPQLAARANKASVPEREEKPRQKDSEQASDAKVAYDIMLGVNGDSPQYGLLGELSGKKIAVDLNQTHTISLFGVQGGGKSYTLGTVVEMASMPLEHINVLPNPLATLIFHYSSSQDYAPEFTSMINPNSVDEEIRILRERYNANPEALKNVLILTPRNKVGKRKAEYPDIEVKPIAFSASELKASHWKFLMGTVGSQKMYMQQIIKIMRDLQGNISFDALRAGIDNSILSRNLKALAHTRLEFSKNYIDDSQSLQNLIQPGRLIIVDLRDEYIEKSEALGLFVVMLQIFSEATYRGNAYNKLVVFDEAHKYIENGDLVSELIEIVREMRHKGTTVLVASQDPPSVPVPLIELSSQIIMHKFNSPAWLKHIQKANSALSELTSDNMSHLGAGEAFVWSSKASDDTFTRGAVKINCRPRITQHGGSTKTAVSEHQ